jgi:hypothetical protein
MLDPPRPAAMAAVRACQEAGISVKMITVADGATVVGIVSVRDVLPVLLRSL